MFNKFYSNFNKKSLTITMCCVMSGNIILTNPIIAKGDIVQAPSNSNSQEFTGNYSGGYTSTSSSSESYTDLNEAQKVSDFNCKVPTFIPSDYKLNSNFNVAKLSSDNNKILRINFIKDKDKNDYKLIEFNCFKVNPSEFLKYLDWEKPSDGGKTIVESSEESMSVGSINGKSINIKVFYLQNQLLDKKYFVWENECLWYAIPYEQPIQAFDGTNKHIDLSKGDLEKVASSLKSPEEAGNMYNNNTIAKIKENATAEYKKLNPLPFLIINDTQDLKKIHEFITFTPKFPVNISDNISATYSNITYSNEANGPDNKVYYEMHMFYPLEDSSHIIFTQIESRKSYEDIKKNGYFTDTSYELTSSSSGYLEEELKPEKLELCGKEVFKYEKASGVEVYLWKEDGFYCNLSFSNKDYKNQEEVVKKFLIEKPIAESSLSTTLPSEIEKRDNNIKKEEGKIGNTQFEEKKPVVPATIKVTADSTSLKAGKNVTLQADIGQKTPGVIVTFIVTPNVRSEIIGDAGGDSMTDANGIARFVYTRWGAANDTVTVFSPTDKTVKDTTSINWSK